MPTSINSSGITFPNGTTQTTAATATGTVTSVATGNGLSGGTITTTGTLVIACPAYNTVGAYVWGHMTYNPSNFSVTSGSNYAAGTGNGQINASGYGGLSANGYGYVQQNNLTGTWKWMSSTIEIGNGYVSGGDAWGVCCRVA
jgi:hypothetical protein